MLYWRVPRLFHANLAVNMQTTHYTQFVENRAIPPLSHLRSVVLVWFQTDPSSFINFNT